MASFCPTILKFIRWGWEKTTENLNQDIWDVTQSSSSNIGETFISIYYRQYNLQVLAPVLPLKPIQTKPVSKLQKLLL